MCTVIITVPVDDTQPVRLLAVRDEDPGRPWDRLGPWWPDTYPGVVGIRDARAGGAWLAAASDERRLAVLLNRHDLSDRGDDEVATRGWVALESVSGRSPAASPQTRGFNLVEVTAHTARVVSWNGLESRTVDLEPGTHMIAHDDVDDTGTPRIARWLGEFQSAAPASEGRWWMPWVEVLERSAELEPTDDSAIIRDNRPYGYPTLSLLACAASVSVHDVDVHYGELREPGHWGGLELG
jgi:hypothetical protein